MKTSLPHPNFRPVIILSAVLLCAAATGSYTRPAKSAIIPAAQSFTFLESGFTQELIGAGYDPGLWTGVAFAPNGYDTPQNLDRRSRCKIAAVQRGENDGQTAKNLFSSTQSPDRPGSDQRT
ncbi:MAG TPA: hypothetical protein VNQ79_02170, partial [Blastocatellia bacterium]|nr:hypothetical protein [Blastocatellia bacterium]